MNRNKKDKSWRAPPKYFKEAEKPAVEPSKMAAKQIPTRNQLTGRGPPGSGQVEAAFQTSLRIGAEGCHRDVPRKTLLYMNQCGECRGPAFLTSSDEGPSVGINSACGMNVLLLADGVC